MDPPVRRTIPEQAMVSGLVEEPLRFFELYIWVYTQQLGCSTKVLAGEMPQYSRFQVLFLDAVVRLAMEGAAGAAVLRACAGKAVAFAAQAFHDAPFCAFVAESLLKGFRIAAARAEGEVLEELGRRGGGVTAGRGGLAVCVGAGVCGGEGLLNMDGLVRGVEGLYGMTVAPLDLTAGIAEWAVGSGELGETAVQAAVAARICCLSALLQRLNEALAEPQCSGVLAEQLRAIVLSKGECVQVPGVSWERVRGEGEAGEAVLPDKSSIEAASPSVIPSLLGAARCFVYSESAVLAAVEARLLGRLEGAAISEAYAIIVCLAGRLSETGLNDVAAQRLKSVADALLQDALVNGRNL